MKLFWAADPDSGGASVPVVVEDDIAIAVREVRLYRRSVEGSSRALAADVTLDLSSVTRSAGTKVAAVWVYVLTDGFVATMTDAMEFTVPGDLDEVWDMATVSAGAGTIRAVFVRTVVEQGS